MRVVNATQLLGGRNLIHEGNAVIFKGILMYLSPPLPPSRFTSVFTDGKHFSILFCLAQAAQLNTPHARRVITQLSYRRISEIIDRFGASYHRENVELTSSLNETYKLNDSSNGNVKIENFSEIVRRRRARIETREVGCIVLIRYLEEYNMARIF